MNDGQPVLRGRVVTSAGVVDDAVLEVLDGRIEAVRPLAQWTFGNRGAEPPPHLGTLLPGLVDIHNHGGYGHRFDTTDPEQARAAALPPSAGGHDGAGEHRDRRTRHDGGPGRGPARGGHQR